MPNTVYNFYIMKDRTAENAFSKENLLYLNQGITDENGNIFFEYADSTDFADAEKFVMAFKNALPDSAVGDSVVTATTDKVTINLKNTDLNGYNNIFARFTVDEESFDITEYTANDNSMQFVCDLDSELPENAIITVQLFASYQGLQYQSKTSSCLLIDARCDLDADGALTALDTALLRQTLLGVSDAVQDINGDGKSDILDLIHLKKHLADVI